MATMDAAGTSSSGGGTGGGVNPLSGSSDGYDDMHRLVLQGMMSAGILNAKGVKKLFITACSYLELDSEERTSMSYVQKVVRDINDKIKPYGMAIRSASCELTGIKYYIFLITVEKPLMKLQTLFTAFEVGLLQKVIDIVFRKYPNFTAPFSECINLAHEVEPKGNIVQAETFIKKMVEMNYLTTFPLEGDDFNITIGIRGLRELEPMLQDCYGGYLGNCILCKTTMLHGLLCPDCHIAIHKHCYTRYLKDLRGVSAALCPSCNVSWDDKSHMLVRMRDEDFDDETNEAPEDEQSPERGEGQGEDGEDDDDDPIPMPTLSRMTIQETKQKPKTRRGRRRNVSSDDSD